MLEKVERKPLKKGWWEKREDFQKEMAKKYNVEILLQQRNGMQVKCYECNSCGELEAFGFIDMYECNCRACGTKKVVEKELKKQAKVDKLELTEGEEYDTQEDIAEALGKSRRTIIRMIESGKIIKTEAGKYRVA